MKNISRIMAVFLGLLICAANLNAGMYSWTDENGVRHYGNVDVSGDAENVQEIKEAKKQTAPAAKTGKAANQIGHSANQAGQSANQAGQSVNQTGQSANQAGLKQIEALRQQMMADPSIMKMIEQLQTNPEIMKILQDPAVLNAYNNGDIAALMTNPDLLKLLNDPTVQAINQKMLQDGKSTTSSQGKATQ